MDRGKRAAVALALVIIVIVAGVGAYLILSAGAPEEDLSWVPTITPYVDDRAGVMSYSDYVDLDEFCYEVELNNTCQVAVLIVNTTQPIGINDYAIKTFEKNGIGQEGKDNGVLFVFSDSEKAWRVVTGAGVSDILNGARLTELRQLYLDPYLESGDYSTGIKLYVHSIGQELVDNYSSSGEASSGNTFLGITLAWWQWTLIVLVVVFLVVGTRGRILIWIPYLILSLIGKGGGGWGGGGTGGGGARGRF
ncbi:MAG: TPM domain-containing protein [Methanomassiliicoccales archaeon]|nr:TPM domain-containing protein [Methanomassiliicoccales archaeon]MDD1755372.1 TPM domain-containing protein [Methanomassiliicoccales archaeon]